MNGASSLSQYDLLLAAIVLPLVLASVAGALLPVEMVSALTAGSVPSSGSMGYALFYNPPDSS